MSTPRHMTISERVRDDLRKQILDGTYPPGSFLPSQRSLAEDLGVDRGHVRGALSDLEQLGLVRAMHGRGTQVVPVHERRCDLRIAFIHNPIGRWITKEGTHLATGVLDRLAASGHPYERMCCDEGEECPSGSPSPHRMVPPASLASVVEKYDGVIFLEVNSPVMADVALERERQGKPIVVANLEFEVPVSGICVDHYAVARRAVEMFANYGHTRIAYVGQAPSVCFYGRCLEGYRQGLIDAGIEVDDSLIAFAERTGELSAYDVAKTLFGSKVPPTAVFAARDILAQGVCHAAEEAGFRVGYDVSVIGFDNVSWPNAEGFLTTFAEPCYDMGVAAVDLLFDRLYNGPQPTERRVLDTPLMLRRSAGPVPLDVPE